jgi:two-component system, NtrC family, response regulator AtoC
VIISMEDHKRTLLVVDDEAAEIGDKFKVLEKHGWRVVMESDDKQALSRIEALYPDVVMLDLHFPDDVNNIGETTTGWELQKEILSKYSDIAVVLFTKTYDDGHIFQDQPPAHGIYRKKRLYELFKQENGDELLAQDLSKALDDAIVKAIASVKPKDYKKLLGFVVGKTADMLSLAEFIIKIAPTEVNVLIEGEHGTGKGRAAKAIHDNSLRINNPFVIVECTKIPKELLESTLFGQLKGSFTGATDKIGYFEMADGGTIFLDEIGDMLPELQGKLLRFIQDKQYEKVGGTGTINANVRIIAATNKDLERAIERGDFRSDLYYRLKQIGFVIPPLRERIDDLPELCESLLPGICRKLNKENKTLRQEVYPKLRNYSWPGNIRQLENLLLNSVIRSNYEFIFAGDVILPEDSKVKTTTITVPVDNIPSETPSSDVDMIKHYMEKVDTLLAGERYDFVKEIPKQMKKDFFFALVEFLRKQLQKKVENKDIAQYLCGATDNTTCATVRQYLRTNGFYLRGPVRSNE